MRFLLNLEDVVLLYKQLSDFKTFGTPTNFTQRNKTLNKLSTFYCFYQIGIVLSVNITSSALSLEACKTDDGLRQRLNEACGLITPTWLPFDFHQIPLKCTPHFTYTTLQDSCLT
nr:unnamed protein product [Callosobruchus analis]